MLTNKSGWTGPLKQSFLTKSALYSILKQKILTIWDISKEYSATLVEFLGGSTDKIKIKTFSKTKNLGKKKSANCGTQFWSFSVQLKVFHSRLSAKKHNCWFRPSMKKDQNWVSQIADFFALDFLLKDTFFHTLLCWVVSVALLRSHYNLCRIQNIDVTIVQG